MRKFLSIIFVLMISGCASAPSSIVFNDITVGTIGASAGCRTLSLNQDRSQISGSTRAIVINDIALRVSGGMDGSVVLVMSKPKFFRDEEALKNGSRAVEEVFANSDIDILSTKVMYGVGTVFGVHYTLDGDGYSKLKPFSVTQ